MASGCPLTPGWSLRVPTSLREVPSPFPTPARGRRPAPCTADPHDRLAAPVVVYLFGGRWQNDSKDQYRLLGDALTRRGLVLVVPDYRLYPEVEFPGWVEDAARAVRWTRDNIQRFGGDPGRIWVVGHSAGGHTAALLALDDRYLREAGVPTPGVQGFVSLAGPVNSEWTAADVQALMGPRAGWPATYPATHIDGTERPLLLLHGSGDRTVSPANSVSLAKRIREQGGVRDPYSTLASATWKSPWRWRFPGCPAHPCWRTYSASCARWRPVDVPKSSRCRATELARDLAPGKQPHARTRPLHHQSPVVTSSRSGSCSAAG
jgi:pimeloyl-ACP methyl ester carboxylesterase